MRISDKDKIKKLTIIFLIPLLLVSQYYLFKFGILKPMIKGVDINIINGEYIQDIDKYVIRLGEEVTLSSGDYIKIPKYAKNPDIKFRVLDDSKVIQIIDNDSKEKNTATMIGLKEGYSSIAVVKNSRVIKKATVLVVDPKVENLDLNIDRDLVFVGDSAKLDSVIEVDFKRFKDDYEVTYESSDESVLRIVGNEVKAIGVGSATIYAKSGDKVDSIRYKINAKVASLDVDKSIEVEVGASKKIDPKIITSPNGLKHPPVEYQLVESKLPIERAIRLDRNGNVVGLREGEEKVLVSCGIGENKKSQIVTVKVIKESLLNQLIDDLISKYEIIDNRILITLNWSSLKDIYKYDIYIRNNSLGDTNYKVVESILMDKIDLDSQNKIKATIELDIGDLKDINLDFYVVGVTDNGNTDASNLVNIQHSTELEENDDLNVSASLDTENKRIILSWNSIDNCKYNVYVKDISKGNQEFMLVGEGLSETNYIINLNEDEFNLEVYVVAIKDGKEVTRSDVKAFK